MAKETQAFMQVVLMDVVEKDNKIQQVRAVDSADLLLVQDIQENRIVAMLLIHHLTVTAIEAQVL